MAASPAIPDTATAEAEAEATLASDESLQADMPMTMAASVVLDHLPRDAHTALSKAGLLDKEKSKKAPPRFTQHPPNPPLCPSLPPPLPLFWSD